MVYVPTGTFHMGPSDEDVNYTFTARNKSVSISGFWMDATEITTTNTGCLLIGFVIQLLQNLWVL